MTSENTKSNKIHTDHLVPGMELAKDILSDDGNVLISTGTTISQHTINKLKNWGILFADVRIEVTHNPIIDPKVEKFIYSYSQSVDVIQETFETIRSSQEMSMPLLNSTAEDLSSTATEAGNIIDRLYELPHIDDYTLYHCVNVGVISALIASWLGYPQNIINAISLTGLLHDIGKSQLPPELLNRPDQLSTADYEHYKKHTSYGFELVRKRNDIAHSVKAGIIQHHERRDGTGYPYRLSGDKIHPYSEIVAIADVYDEALTVNRTPSSLVYNPYAGLEKVDDLKYQLNANFCKIFTSRMINYLTGNLVSLTDGRQGRIVFLNHDNPARSMVQIPDGTVLDLQSIPDLRIHYVIRSSCNSPLCNTYQIESEFPIPQD